MQLINGYYGTPVIELIETQLSENKGDELIIGVGYAQDIQPKTLSRLGTALDLWLSQKSSRRFHLFIGDHRHPKDTLTERKRKIKAATEAVAALSNFGRSIEEQIEIGYLAKLHAKFFSMWTTNPTKRLEWVVLGSSNLTDAALAEKNIELDLFFDVDDVALQDMAGPLAMFVSALKSDCDSWGSLHDEVNKLTAKTRHERDKERLVEEDDRERLAEEEAEEDRQKMNEAHLESDRKQGILGSD